MKRTEALVIIDRVYGEFCDDWLKADIDNLEGFVPLNERILSALEKAGMLPPAYAPEDSGLVWSDEKTGEPNGFKLRVSKWEPEDEEK